MFKFGNRKIGKDTIIFSMYPVYECPSQKAGLCKFRTFQKQEDGSFLYAGDPSMPQCYGSKMEWSKKVRSHRERQSAFWLNNTSQTISECISAKIKMANHEVKYARFNENGDVRDFADLEKLFSISNLLPSLTIYIYTKQHDLLRNFIKAGNEIPKNLGISLSVVEGSFIPFDLAFLNKFYATPEIPKNVKSKCAGKCETCNKCKVLTGKTTYIKFH
jgi:hypothetical protein